MTKIVDVEARLFGGGSVTEPANAASMPIQSRAGVLLELLGSDGHVGRGEASPLDGFHEESVATALAALADVGSHVRRFDFTGRASLDTIANDNAIRALPPSARFALETALVDWMAKAAGVTSSRWLSDHDVPNRCLVSTYCGSLLDGDAPDRAAGAAARGYKALKWKTTTDDLDAEAKALECIRHRVGTVELRVDWNGGRSILDARRALDVYARYGVSFVEEPCAGEALLELGETRTPWFADESLRGPSLAAALLRCRACAGVVIKPAMFGLFAARRIAIDARSRGKSVVLTHMFDGPIALLAVRAVAASLPFDPRASALGEHAGLAAFPPIALPSTVPTRDGPVIETSATPGLGYGAGTAWTS